MREELMVQEKNITDQVLNRVTMMQTEGSIMCPPNYSYQNALKSAYLILKETKNKEGKIALECCTQESIANTLLEMVVQGLNPTKEQCYFIVYGNKLQLSRSYLGTIAITKRLKGVKDVKGYPVYKNDVFEMEFDITTGIQKLKEYQPNIKERASNDLIGAFAIVIGDGNEILHTEYMNMDQIRAAWNMGQTKGNSKAHANFADQMAIKSVINRACKQYINTSDDSDIIAEQIRRSEEISVQAEITANANSEALGFEEDAIEADVIEMEEGAPVAAEPEEFASQESEESAPF